LHENRNKPHNAELRKAVEKLFILSHIENDKLSPLTPFQVSMYKRVQILDKVQESQLAKLAHIKVLYQAFSTFFFQLRLFS